MKVLTQALLQLRRARLGTGTREKIHLHILHSFFLKSLEDAAGCSKVRCHFLLSAPASRTIR